MTDDSIRPLLDRISRLIGDEERLNRNRKSARNDQTTHREAEKRSEATHLATLDREKDHQLAANARKEHTYQEALRREGEELVHLSKAIQDEYRAEIRHRESAKEKLQSKISTLEARLRHIEGARA